MILSPQMKSFLFISICDQLYKNKLMIIDNNHSQLELTPFRKDESEDERKVFDNIHGFIRFEKRIWYFIDTPEFQKLRYIKQLGVLSHVFPGATHTRFEHSLGTGHLAKTFITLLIKNNPERYEKISEEEKTSAIFTITLAGIMHDIGHGPFSHTFDGQIVKTKVWQKDSTKQGDKWSHEIGSELIFRHIVEHYKLIEKGAITGPEVERVVKLIHGVSDGVRAWEFELISNKWTGIDVDKLDYFRRDAFYLGAKGVLIDHDLLMNEARILVDEKNSSAKYIIGYPSKYALQVNDIFYSRYKLYKTFYLNSISKGVEFMIMDVLKLIEPIFQFTTICQNIKQGKEWIDRYVALTDSILQRVEWLDEKEAKYDGDMRGRILEAKGILVRLKERKIYKFVREVQTSITIQILKENRKLLEQIFDTENIAEFIERETGLSRGLFHIAVTEAGYGLKNLNPLNKVKFFRKENYRNSHQKYKALDEEQFHAENISILYTKAFAERYAKLFVKNVQQGDLQNVTKINLAFYKYFDNKKRECGNIFYHLNMGRTSFIPSDVSAGRFTLGSDFIPASNTNQDSLP